MPRAPFYKYNLLYIHLARKYWFSSLVKDESYYGEPTRLKILPLPHSVCTLDATYTIKLTAICVDFLIYAVSVTQPAAFIFPSASDKRREGKKRKKRKREKGRFFGSEGASRLAVSTQGPVSGG